MLIIPLYTLFIAYAIFLLIFLTFFFINLWHIFFTGTTTFQSFIATFIVAALSILTIFATGYFLQNIDWQQPFFIFNIGSITNLFHSGGAQYF